MPDHISYGVSNTQHHPYEMKDVYTHSTYNLLLASKAIENAWGQVDTTILIGEGFESVILPFTLNILKEINYDLY